MFGCWSAWRMRREAIASIDCRAASVNRALEGKCRDLLPAEERKKQLDVAETIRHSLYGTEFKTQGIERSLEMMLISVISVTGESTNRIT